MFKKLFSLFKKDKEELELGVEELEQWLKTKKTESIKVLEPVCKDLLASLKEYIDELKESVDNLSKAEIKDEDKIEQRIISIVLSNRRSFINQANFFLGRIDMPNYEDVNQIIEFGSRLKEELDNFAKVTHKSFYTSQHLFYKQVENTKKVINKISKLTENFNKRVISSGLDNFEDVENNINLLKESIDNKFSLLEELNKLKIKLKHHKMNKIDNEERIKQIKDSPTYKYYLEEKSKLKELEDEIKQLKLKVEHNFTIMERALKKYTKIEEEEEEEEYKLIYGYQVNTFETLIKDKELKIIEVLQKITQKILSKELVLKDSEKQKILSEINKINRDYLGNIIKENKGLEKRRKELEQEINKNQVISDIDSIKHKIKNTENDIEILEKDINNMNKNINKIDDINIKQDIEKEFDDIFGICLKIKLVENDKRVHKELHH